MQWHDDAIINHNIRFAIQETFAKKHLCGQPTSVASERIFSTAGDTVTASRSRLLADEVDKLIFVKKKCV
jgi:hypothetical protein